jgi:nuclear GTP-binding protein
MAWPMSVENFAPQLSTNTDRCAQVKVKGENFYRDAKKVKVIKRLTGGTATRNAKGDITQSAIYQSREAPVARVEPNRKWFNNTRVISQDALESFRSAVQAQASDPTSYLLKRNKLPMSLIEETKNVNGIKQHQAKIAVESQPFKDTFGPKAQRKRPKLDFDSIESLAGRTDDMHDNYLDRLEQAELLSGNSGAALDNPDGNHTTAREAIFSKGTSKRIWNELYKVIDSSDVILHVIDARDPVGTRCRSVEKYLKTEAPHKHLVFVLNKVDLVPSRVAVSATSIFFRSARPSLLPYDPSISQGSFPLPWIDPVTSLEDQSRLALPRALCPRVDKLSFC